LIGSKSLSFLPAKEQADSEALACKNVTVTTNFVSECLK
jgi:hypothetical protein